MDDIASQLGALLPLIFSSKYGAVAVNVFFAWTALAWICLRIRSRVNPPKVESWLRIPYRIIDFISGTYGFASSSYDLGTHSVKIPLSMSRTEASLALGLDPATTSPMKRGIPKLIKADNEEITTQSEKAVTDTQAVIAETKTDGELSADQIQRLEK